MTEGRKGVRRDRRAANLTSTATEHWKQKQRAIAESKGISERTVHTSGPTTDEAEDHGSSWDSEPEGEEAEELASLEAPDDEGVWCWPKRNRITR